MVSTVPKTVHDVDDIFKAFVWGEAFGRSPGRVGARPAVAQWPSENDPGISFLELTINWLICSGMEQPCILGSRKETHVEYVASEVDPVVAHQKYDWQKQT